MSAMQTPNLPSILAQNLPSLEVTNLILITLAALALLLTTLAIPIVFHFQSVNNHWKADEYKRARTWIKDVKREFAPIQQPANQPTAVLTQANFDRAVSTYILHPSLMSQAC